MLINSPVSRHQPYVSLVSTYVVYAHRQTALLTDTFSLIPKSVCLWELNVQYNYNYSHEKTSKEQLIPIPKRKWWKGKKYKKL